LALLKDDLAVLTAKISANVRVDLYEKNYLCRVKWTFPLLLLISLISLSFLFSIGAMNQSQLVISSLLAIVILTIVRLTVRRARIAALKGDTLILKGINAKSTVTSIRSIRKASSYHFFGIQVTRLNYTLDKQNRSSLVFGTPSGMSTSLDHLLNHAKQYKKK